MQQQTENKYQLAICEIHHPLLHGSEDDKDAITTHFLIYATYSVNEFYNNDYKIEEAALQRYRQEQNRVMRLNENHPSLRNYNQKYIRLEIIQYHISNNASLSGASSGTLLEYHVAYLKTFWLRIVQRCWKKVYKARQELLAKRFSIKALEERQRTGSWPKHLQLWPQFRLGLSN